MAYDTILYSIQDAVATITLNRPASYNALNLTLGRELFLAALEADEDPAVRCIVLTGAGRAFCGGGDVKDFAASGDRIGVLLKELTTYLHGTVSRLARTAKPVIMAVNGVAAGGGMSLALAGDLVVATESATFNMAYAKIAASPDGSATYFLPRLIGMRRALELHYTNRVLSAREAMDWGARDPGASGRRVLLLACCVGQGACRGPDLRVRARQAPVPPVDTGEPRIPDGARGAGPCRVRAH